MSFEFFGQTSFLPLKIPQCESSTNFSSSLKEILNYKSDKGKIEIQFLLVIDNDTRNVNCHIQEWCV